MLRRIVQSKWLVLLVNIVSIIGFGYAIFLQQNVEFFLYWVAIITVFIAIIRTNHTYKYDALALWGLTLLTVLNLAGGLIHMGSVRLYDMMLVPIIGDPYNILKYDQVVHVFGIYITTVVLWHIFKKHYNTTERRLFSHTAILMVLLAVASMGVGALNEVVEFMVTLVSGSNGVGGYENTALDLLANLTGSTLASMHIYRKHKTRKRRS